MRTKRTIYVILLGMVVLGAGTATRAMAAQPYFETVIIDRTYEARGLENYCGFPSGSIYRHDYIPLSVQVFYDGNGNAVREIDHTFGTATWTGMGHTMTGRYSGFDNYSFNQQGSIVEYLGTGQGAMVVLPGAGPVWGQRGSIDVFYDANGNIVSLRDDLQDATSPAVCAYFQQ